VQCSKYFCAGCQRGHKKPRLSAGHEFVAVEKALEGKMVGASAVERQPHGEVEGRVVCRRDYSKVGGKPAHHFGSEGAGDGQFVSIYSIACNSRGEIVVADWGNHRIQVFDRDGKFLFKFGKPEGQGKRNGQFASPEGVTVDQRNNQIMVADTWNHRVQIFDEQGKFIRAFGSNGSGEGEFVFPVGVVVSQQGNYVVTDARNNRIQIFNSECQFVKKVGKEGKGNGQLRGIYGVGVLSNGNIVVAELNGNRLQIFDSEGKFVRIVGAGQVTNPRHLFVDSDDNILVADWSNNRLQVFHQNGTHVKSIGNGQLPLAFSVCMDREGRVIVGDGYRVAIF